MEQFWSNVKLKIESNSEAWTNGSCRIWTGNVKNGYGQFTYRDPQTFVWKVKTAHRMALMASIRDLTCREGDMQVIYATIACVSILNI